MIENTVSQGLELVNPFFNFFLFFLTKFTFFDIIVRRWPRLTRTTGVFQPLVPSFHDHDRDARNTERCKRPPAIIYKLFLL